MWEMRRHEVLIFWTTPLYISYFLLVVFCSAAMSPVFMCYFFNFFQFFFTGFFYSGLCRVDRPIVGFVFLYFLGCR